MIYWSVFSFILLVSYVVLIGYFLVGLLRVINKARRKRESSNVKQNTFTIIVPARNEEKTIALCLHSIINQTYNNTLFEIIVLNDYSTDNTGSIVNNLISEFGSGQIRLVNLSDLNNIKNKKEAITKGIEEAKNDYIILTDADCTRNENWLETINNYIGTTNAKMIYAPVEFTANTIFEKLQALEFAGLVGIGAAAIELKNPNMCSAANLIFEKQVFFEVDGYKDNMHIASGDDEFLMHKVFKLYPDAVKFLYNDKAIVQTSPNGTLQQLAQQRKRWVSKSTKYENRYITLILAMAYFFNVSILINLAIDAEIAVYQLLFKTLIEGIFLYKILQLYKKTNLIMLLPIAEVFHILYVIIIGIWANFGTYNWKDRQHK